MMYEYFQDLITTAFDFDGIDRGARKVAFAQLMIGVVIVVAIAFNILMVIGDYIRNRRAEASICNDVTADLPLGTSRDLKHELVAREKANRRSAYTAPALPPIDLASKPADRSYFLTVRAFAEEKQKTGKVMNAYEREAVGPIAFLYDAFGPEGFGHFDAFSGTVPFRTHELRAMMERLELHDLVSAVESSTSVHLQRYQMFQDFTATGMPAEQAKAHPDIPSYKALNNTVKVAGGQERILNAANQYLEAVYPWLSASAH